MPRCRICKDKFEAKFFNQKTCFNASCVIEFKNITKQKEWKERKKVLKDGLKRKQDYEKDLEVVFNKFIRLRDKDEPCISCDAPAGTYKLTAGHFYPAGSYKNLRFNEDNVNSQCWWNCNKNKSGNLLEYRPRLIKKIGIERVEELERLKNIPAHYTIPELKEMIKQYKLKNK